MIRILKNTKFAPLLMLAAAAWLWVGCEQQMEPAQPEKTPAAEQTTEAPEAPAAETPAAETPAAEESPVETPAPETPAPETTQPTETATTGTTEAASAPAEVKTDAPAPSGVVKPVVIMETSLGDIEIELYPDKAPITVENFLTYVKAGFYGGTIFHRVIPGFMIQGGGFLPGMQEKPTRAPIKNEAENGLKNLRGTIAMARTGVVDSATAQFFINVSDNGPLDHTEASFGYAVFGMVTKGMDVADRIVGVPTKTINPGTRNQMDDVPVNDVIIKSIRVKE